MLNLGARGDDERCIKKSATTDSSTPRRTVRMTFFFCQNVAPNRKVQHALHKDFRCAQEAEIWQATNGDASRS
jgi:hypothetical protein